MSSPGHIQEKERGRPSIVLAPELSDMIFDFLHADDSNSTFLVIHHCCSIIRPADISDQRLPMPGRSTAYLKLSLNHTPPRYLSKVLLADRGEMAVYTAQVTSNATLADEAVKLDDPSWFVSSERITDIAKRFTQATLRARLNPLIPALGRPNDTSLGPTRQTLRIAGTRCSPNLQRISVSGDDKGAGRGMRVVSTQEGSRRRSNGSLDSFGIASCMGETQLGQFPSEKALGRNEITSRSRSPATVPETWPNYGSESVVCSGDSRSSLRRDPRHHPESSSTPTRRRDDDGACLVHGVSIAWPVGRGVHVDTWLCRAGVRECNVGTGFNALLAKILGQATQQAARALRETAVGNEAGGVKTDRTAVAGVVVHAHWEERKCDTVWLERELRNVITIGMDLLKLRVDGLGLQGQQGAKEVTVTLTSASGSGSLPMQPEATFHLFLSPPRSKTAADMKKNTLMLTSIAHNTFATHLSGTLRTTFSPFAFPLKQVQSSAGAHDLAEPSDSTHVATLLTGKVVEPSCVQRFWRRAAWWQRGIRLQC
ncbi:hypothetical protein FIBSPDRAFT_895339 [Athelia psychrophila]|uniref:Uncharacterized protein n=1 Tax=Athelia psychrophila TaxID=1759441 RepID=A0A166EPJ2_9AGAM|nr:hypothetical protein FIBSPDRAFT_895339 [Fibularhizoctonia sp. CBS 109695]